jgi:protein disulfide-isomerase A1
MTGALQGRSALHCFNNIDEEEHTTEPFATVGGLEAFIKRCSAPLIPELTRVNEAEYVQVSQRHPPHYHHRDSIYPLTPN